MSRIREWPSDATTGANVTRPFIAAYRKAFESDPLAKFCAGEIDGVTLVVAVGDTGRKLQRFVEQELDGVIQREPKDDRAGRMAGGEPA